MKKQSNKKKIPAQEFLKQLRQEEDPRVLKFIRKIVKHDKKERFGKVVA